MKKETLYYILFIVLAFLAIKIFWPLIVAIIVLFIAFKLYMDYKRKKLVQDLEDQLNNHQTYTGQRYYQESSSNPDIIDVDYTVKEENS